MHGDRDRGRGFLVVLLSSRRKEEGHYKDGFFRFLFLHLRFSVT